MILQGPVILDLAQDIVQFNDLLAQQARDKFFIILQDKTHCFTSFPVYFALGS